MGAVDKVNSAVGGVRWMSPCRALRFCGLEFRLAVAMVLDPLWRWLGRPGVDALGRLLFATQFYDSRRSLAGQKRFDMISPALQGARFFKAVLAAIIDASDARLVADVT